MRSAILNVTLLFSLLLTTIALTTHAHAEGSTHYQDVLLGARAAGMGGAAIALGGEATGNYYNPASILSDKSLLLQVSMTALRWRQKRTPVLDICGHEIVEDDGGFFIFPASLGFTKLFGKKLRQAVGFSLLVPSMTKQAQAYLVDDATCGVHTIDLGGNTWVVDRVFLGSLTYALKPTPWLRIGLSVGVAVRDVSQANLTNFVLRQTGQGDAINVTYNELQVTTWSLYAQLGAIAEIFPGFHVGLNITSPYLPLVGRGRFDMIETLRDPTDPSIPLTGTSSILTLDDAEFHWKVPLALGLGLAYAPKKRFAFAFDIKLHLPVSAYAQVTHPLLPPSDDLQDARELVININAGAEIVVWPKHLTLRAGVFTNFSADPKPDELGLIEGEEQLHLFGGTFGGALRTNDASVITFALQVMGGRGDRAQLHLIPAQNETAPLTFDNQTTKTTDISVMISVGGAVELD